MHRTFYLNNKIIHEHDLRNIMNNGLDFWFLRCLKSVIFLGDEKSDVNQEALAVTERYVLGLLENEVGVRGFEKLVFQPCILTGTPQVVEIIEFINLSRMWFTVSMTLKVAGSLFLNPHADYIQYLSPKFRKLSFLLGGAHIFSMKHYSFLPESHLEKIAFIGQVRREGLQPMSIELHSVFTLLSSCSRLRKVLLKNLWLSDPDNLLPTVVESTSLTGLDKFIVDECHLDRDDRIQRLGCEGVLQLMNKKFEVNNLQIKDTYTPSLTPFHSFLGYLRTMELKVRFWKSLDLLTTDAFRHSPIQEVTLCPWLSEMTEDDFAVIKQFQAPANLKVININLRRVFFDPPSETVIKNCNKIGQILLYRFIWLRRLSIKNNSHSIIDMDGKEMDSCRAKLVQVNSKET
ncbi:hypothetical protein TRICI_003982 [Trichomonascus ciferrii]|uniref:Uncharacterized protein n=1 Tax=Trichomonascus ciferrii TaxID=44093 RepID=A0A642V1U6_9ASCO|nr:hypothetical protein TRICI_003982 [Trichomonascus ciferrii]